MTTHVLFDSHSMLVTTDAGKSLSPSFCDAASCLLGPPTTYTHGSSVSFVVSASSSPLSTEMTPKSVHSSSIFIVCVLLGDLTYSHDLTIFSVQTTPKSTTQPWHQSGVFSCLLDVFAGSFQSCYTVNLKTSSIFPLRTSPAF